MNVTKENLKITITPKGMTVDAAGYQGGACLNDLDKLNRFLAEVGISPDVKDQKMKSESYARQTQTNKQARRW